MNSKWSLICILRLIFPVGLILTTISVNAESFGASAAPTTPKGYEEPERGPWAKVRFVATDADSKTMVMVNTIRLDCGSSKEGSFIASLGPREGFNEGYKGKRLHMPLGEGITEKNSTEVKLPADKEIILNMQAEAKASTTDVIAFGVIGATKRRVVCPQFIKTSLKSDHFYEFEYEQGSLSCTLKGYELTPDERGGFTKASIDARISEDCNGSINQKITKAAKPNDATNVKSAVITNPTDTVKPPVDPALSPSTPPSSSSPVARQNGGSIPQKLRELDGLRKEGLITEAEFQEKKNKLLDQY